MGREAAVPESIGTLECETIHRGFETVDAMLKTARVSILAASPVPPGRFLIVVGGPVAEVDSAWRRGLELAGPLHDRLFLPEVHPAVLDALRFRELEEEVDTLGLFETASVGAVLDGADRGAKGSGARLLRLHLTKGIAGKAFGLFSGRQDSVEAALAMAEERGRAHGRWVGATLLARPDALLVRHVLREPWGFMEGSEIL